MWRVILIFLAAFGGFWFGKAPVKNTLALTEKFPIVEHKSFVVVIYAYNQALWCERALRSIFEQDYDHYRVILIDDSSTDGTQEKANQFIVDNNQDEKVILMRNETKMGQVGSLKRAIDTCLDREIIIPLDAKDWFSSPAAFNQLNAAYQNPDVWAAFGQAIDYPSYEIRDGVQISYYATLFKQAGTPEMSDSRARKIQEPIAFSNKTSD
jgi:glycosyltransferase involved in cell wall biosynthesis